jgi:hypothetical protein
LLRSSKRPRRLDDHIDTKLAPGKIRRAGNRKGSHAMLTDGDRVRIDRNLLGEAAKDRIELEQMRHRLQIAEIAQRDDLKARPTVQRSAQEVPPDPPEAVDGDPGDRAPAGGPGEPVDLERPLRLAPFMLPSTPRSS